MKTALAALLLMSMALVPLGAHSQPVRDPAAADELFERGKELLSAGNWPEACAKFRASMSFDPAVGTLLKMARCDEHDQRLSLALHDYQAALQLNGLKTDQTEARRTELEAFTRAALAQLEPRVPKLRIVIAEPPPDLRLMRGDEELPIAALGEDLSVDPGTIDIVASAPGYQTERRAIVLREGARMEVTISLMKAGGSQDVPLPPPIASDARPSSPAVPATDPGASRRIGAYVLGGSGIVSLCVAGYFAIETLSQVSQASAYCSDNKCKQPGYDLISEAGKAQTAGLAFLAVGASLVGAGVVVFLTSPSRPSPHSATSSARVVLGPSGGFVGGAF